MSFRSPISVPELVVGEGEKAQMLVPNKPFPNGCNWNGGGKNFKVFKNMTDYVDSQHRSVLAN